MGPSARAITEFSAEPDAVTLLPGGQGTSWLAGSVVLKPLDRSEEQLEWEAGVLGALETDGFRIALPIRSMAGGLVVDGWTASTYVEGQHEERWAEIVVVGERLHGSLVAVPDPGFLRSRRDRWADADRFAWGESPALVLEHHPPGVRSLLEARRDVQLPDQLIHADLSGNVLFGDDQAPAVIDFSPYWRPKDYASAVVAVDAIAWCGAGLELMEERLAVPEGRQLFIRALLFRLLSDSDPQAGRYEPMIERLCGTSVR